MKKSYLNILNFSNANIHYWLMENKNLSYEESLEYQNMLDGFKYACYNMGVIDDCNTDEEIMEPYQNKEYYNELMDYEKNSFILECVSNVLFKKQEDIKNKLEIFNNKSKILCLG